MAAGFCQALGLHGVSRALVELRNPVRAAIAYTREKQKTPPAIRGWGGQLDAGSLLPISARPVPHRVPASARVLARGKREPSRLSKQRANCECVAHHVRNLERVPDNVGRTVYDGPVLPSRVPPIRIRRVPGFAR